MTTLWRWHYDNLSVMQFEVTFRRIGQLQELLNGKQRCVWYAHCSYFTPSWPDTAIPPLSRSPPPSPRTQTERVWLKADS